MLARSRMSTTCIYSFLQSKGVRIEQTTCQGSSRRCAFEMRVLLKPLKQRPQPLPLPRCARVQTLLSLARNPLSCKHLAAFGLAGPGLADELLWNPWILFVNQPEGKIARRPGNCHILLPADHIAHRRGSPVLIRRKMPQRLSILRI